MKICKVNNYTFPARDNQGTQRILESLSKELTKQGHEVSLLLNQDSIIPLEYGKLVSEIPKDADIIHYHGGFDVEYPYNRHNIPWVSTAHGGMIDTAERMEEVKKYVNNIIFVSNAASKMYHSSCYIWNCVSDEDFVYQDKKDDYFLWIAGTDWGEQKGLFSSIMLAKKLGFKLKIAGSGKNTSIIQQIKQLCDNKVEYLGSVNGKEKAQLLAGAKALLMIGDIQDACPVNVVEALCSGTPIIAKNKGSHPEIVNQNVGYVCSSENEIVKAIVNIKKIKPIDCRNHYLSNFTPQISVKKHLQVYKNVLKFGVVKST